MLFTGIQSVLGKCLRIDFISRCILEIPCETRSLTNLCCTFCNQGGVLQAFFVGVDEDEFTEVEFLLVCSGEVLIEPVRAQCSTLVQ